MRYKKAILSVMALMFILLTLGSGQATEIGLGDGLQFSQFDFTFSGASQSNSAYGLAAVDINQLTSGTGLGSGYLNISTSAGWVVQNMPIDSSIGYPGLSTMFNLGNSVGTDVSSLSISADFSAAPVATFSGTLSTNFDVGNLDYNAEGLGIPRSAPPALPSTPNIGWLGGGITTSLSDDFQVFRKSVEQDKNQCAPGAIANSLQYLEDEYDIDVPDDHIPGINGKPPESLVGKIDQAMGRAPHQGVSYDNFMKGKLDYIANNSLGDDLTVKHWGGTQLSGDKNSTTGSVTSIDEQAGISLDDWIIQEIGNGEDVELAGSGHVINVTGAGKILGVPWISWTHDANQGFNDNNTSDDTSDDTTAENGGTNWYDGGVGWSPIINGELVFFLDGYKPAVALSESKSEPVPEPATMFLLGSGLLGLAGFRRRFRKKQP